MHFFKYWRIYSFLVSYLILQYFTKHFKNVKNITQETSRFYNIIYLDGKLYYLSSDGICLLDINSKKTEVLKANVVNFLNMNEQYLFYQSMDGSVVRYDLSTQQEKTIYNGLVDTGYIVGDKLIVKTYVSAYQQESYYVIMDFDGAQQQRLFFDGQGDYI